MSDKQTTPEVGECGGAARAELPAESGSPSYADASQMALVRVIAPHFVAGLIMGGDRCSRAAPILSWALGKSQDELRTYFNLKGWKASVIA